MVVHWNYYLDLSYLLVEFFWISNTEDSEFPFRDSLSSKLAFDK